MKFANATNLHRKSGGTWGTRPVPKGLCCGTGSKGQTYGLASFSKASSPQPQLRATQVFLTHGNVPSVFGAHTHNAHIGIYIENSRQRAAG